jgi:hypothetical protein
LFAASKIARLDWFLHRRRSVFAKPANFVRTVEVLPLLEGTCQGAANGKPSSCRFLTEKTPKYFLSLSAFIACKRVCTLFMPP